MTIVNIGNGTCTELSIVDAIGNVYRSYEPTVTFSDIDLMCSVDIVVPDIVSIKFCTLINYCDFLKLN